MVDIFLFLLLPVVWFPPAGALPALAYFACFYWQHERGEVRFLPLVAGITWAAYAVWEIRAFYWAANVATDGRYDLFFFAPVIYGLSLAAIWACWKPLPAHGKDEL